MDITVLEQHTADKQLIGYNEFPVEIVRPEPTDNDIHMTSTQYKVLKPIFTYLLPGMLILIYLIIWLKRRK